MQFIQSKNNEKFNSDTVYIIDDILLTKKGIVLQIVDIYQTYSSKLVRYTTLKDFYKNWNIEYDLSKFNKK